MTCAAAAGEVRCGPGCKADRGGIVCDAPASSAPGPWESTGDWTCDTVAQHLRDCGLYDHPVLGALGWKLDALRPQWSQGKAGEIKDLCRRHYQEVVTSECRTAP